MNRKQLIVVWVIIVLFLSGCSSYDAGYDDGYDDVSPTIFNKLSNSYKQGYDDGANDAYYFDLGYQDARNDEEPRHPDIEEYMEGYREGK